VSNALTQAVTVYITVSPQTALIAVDGTEPVKLSIAANSSGQARVPFEALTNGEVQLTVSLTDVEGKKVGSSKEVELHVQAGWETIGTVIVAVLIVALFGSGLYRSIRRRRTERAAVADGSDDAPGEATGE
jgi:hypothetical protein